MAVVGIELLDLMMPSKRDVDVVVAMGLWAS